MATLRIRYKTQATDMDYCREGVIEAADEDEALEKAHQSMQPDERLADLEMAPKDIRRIDRSR